MCVQQKVDEGHLHLVNKVLDLEDLNRKLEFLRDGFDEVTENSLSTYSLNIK